MVEKVFPSTIGIKAPEALFYFKSSGKRIFHLSSNCYYEVFDHNNNYIGSGGHRCTQGEAYIDTWDGTYWDTILIRLHWVNPSTSVWYRSIFEDSFFADMDFSTSRYWSSYSQDSIIFKYKVCSQLSRQNLIIPSVSSQKLELVKIDSYWNLIPLPVSPLKIVPVDPNIIVTRTKTDYKKVSNKGLKSKRSYPPPKKAFHRTVDPKVLSSSHTPSHVFSPTPSFSSLTPSHTPSHVFSYIPSSSRTSSHTPSSSFSSPTPSPTPSPTALDLMKRSDITKSIPSSFVYQTVDLGMIGLHHIRLESRSEWLIIGYSEIPDFEKIWSTHNRKKVRLGDALLNIEKGEPLGVRGCRYIHLIFPRIDQAPLLKVWRLEYPLKWKSSSYLPYLSMKSKRLAQACRNNLIACVDGGIVDTCWRERAQWVGDLRMSAKAIKTLTDNSEVVALSLHQIAQSYSCKLGMVQGAWPVKTPSHELFMPPYHLSYCITALEFDSTLEFDPLVKKVVLDSIKFWKENYIESGIIKPVDGWNFIDWDISDASVVGRDISGKSNLVVNAWWMELCRLAGIESGVDLEALNELFFDGIGYRLYPGEHKTNIHATAAILASGYGKKEAYEYLVKNACTKEVKEHVTAYFAYFIAKALYNLNPEESQKFIEFYYYPIVQEFDTIYEKTDATSSMAHGWSVGFIELLS